MIVDHNGETRNGKMAWCKDCDTWVTQTHHFGSYSKTVGLHERGRNHKMQWIAVTINYVPEATVTA